jgi:hypothetical protein
MTRMPVTIADQGVLLDPEEADDLVDLLLEAAMVIGALVGAPEAEAACTQAVTGGRGSCELLAIDLQLAAADIAGQAEASRPPDQERKHKSRNKPAPPGNTRDTPGKTNTPNLTHGNVNE